MFWFFVISAVDFELFRRFERYLDFHSNFIKEYFGYIIVLLRLIVVRVGVVYVFSRISDYSTFELGFYFGRLHREYTSNERNNKTLRCDR